MRSTSHTTCQTLFSVSFSIALKSFQKQHLVTAMTKPNEPPVADMTVPEKQYDEPTSTNQAVANFKVRRSGPGLLDLPPELRLMIFRHLLVHQEGPLHCLQQLVPRSTLNVLRTSRLIHEEAFNVFYRENLFGRKYWLSSCSIDRFPRITDTIQKIQFHIMMTKDCFGWNSERLLNLGKLFGNQSIIRRTFVLVISFLGPCVDLLKWYIRALGWFTNFRTIELYFTFSGITARDYLQKALEPVLGRGEMFKDRLVERGLRFHPTDHTNFRRNQGPGDWANSLDGICLDWNEI